MMTSITPYLMVAMALTLVGANSPEVTDLKQDVADVKSFLINKLAPDVEANHKNVQETRTMTNSAAEQILAFVEEAMTQSANKTAKRMDIMQEAFKEYIENIIETSSQNHKALQNQTQANEEKMSSELTHQLQTAVEEMESRLQQHEAILTTRLAVCGWTHSHRGRDKVVYQQMPMHSVNVAGTKLRGSDVLEMSTGLFTVPQGGTGTYSINYGVMLDTVDGAGQPAPAKFVLQATTGKPKRNGYVKGSMVMSDVGTTAGSDVVPASREVLLHMEAGDSLELRQLNRAAETSYSISLCVHLVHPTHTTSQGAFASKLSTPTIVKLDSTKTYKPSAHSNLEALKIEDLKVILDSPTVDMDAPEALLSPLSPFMTKDPRASSAGLFVQGVDCRFNEEDCDQTVGDDTFGSNGEVDKFADE